MTAQVLSAFLKAADVFSDATVVAPQLVATYGKAEINYRCPTTYWTSFGAGAN